MDDAIAEQKTKDKFDAGMLNPLDKRRSDRVEKDKRRKGRSVIAFDLGETVVHIFAVTAFWLLILNYVKTKATTRIIVWVDGER